MLGFRALASRAFAAPAVMVFIVTGTLTLISIVSIMSSVRILGVASTAVASMMLCVPRITLLFYFDVHARIHSCCLFQLPLPLPPPPSLPPPLPLPLPLLVLFFLLVVTTIDDSAIVLTIPLLFLICKFCEHVFLIHLICV